MFVRYRNIELSKINFFKKMMLKVLQGFLRKTLVKRNLHVIHTFCLWNSDKNEWSSVRLLFTSAEPILENYLWTVLLRSKDQLWITDFQQSCRVYQRATFNCFRNILNQSFGFYKFNTWSTILLALREFHCPSSQQVTFLTTAIFSSGIWIKQNPTKIIFKLKYCNMIFC